MRANHYKLDNIFAKIITGEILSDKIYEDDYLIAINDINPVAPVHVLVIPKNAYIDYTDFINKAPANELVHYFSMINTIIDKLNLNILGYRLITNAGDLSGQTIFHFHTHIISGKKFNNMI